MVAQLLPGRIVVPPGTLGTVMGVPAVTKAALHPPMVTIGDPITVVTFLITVVVAGTVGAAHPAWDTSV